MDNYETDVLIVGSGISGLFAALNIDEKLKVTIISKEDSKTNNSYMAQGGIAVTFEAEDIESHIEDTMKAGGYYNDLPAVRILVEEGRKNIEKLMAYGVEFDQEEGHIAFTKEGGHSIRRIVHKKDYTGKEIIEKLIEVVRKRENIVCYENSFLIDVLTESEGVKGAIALIDNQKKLIQTNHVVLATGGIGKLFMNTTNSSISTGDGIAVAYRAGAIIEDMEFIQFHPTPFQSQGEAFLISEAVRGEGGILRNKNGEAFMGKYHPMKDLAPRDIVSRSILKEQKVQNSPEIYLDVTHFEEGYFDKRFPSIFNYCISKGIDPRKEWIPVNPSEHYLMGGIKTDFNGKTNIEGMYSCGESARTGVQGANRLASNSLLEGIVFGNRVARTINSSGSIVNKSIDINFSELIPISDEYSKDILELKKIMDESANILRSENKLLEALDKIKKLKAVYENKCCNEKEFMEFKNMLIVSELIISMALDRKDSLGSHFMEDSNE